LKWENEFREGVETLPDFKVVIEELNGIDLGNGIFRDSADLT
jgi:hypothetical protein